MLKQKQYIEFRIKQPGSLPGKKKGFNGQKKNLRHLRLILEDISVTLNSIPAIRYDSD